MQFHWSSQKFHNTEVHSVVIMMNDLLHNIERKPLEKKELSGFFILKSSHQFRSFGGILLGFVWFSSRRNEVHKKCRRGNVKESRKLSFFVRDVLDSFFSQTINQYNTMSKILWKWEIAGRNRWIILIKVIEYVACVFRDIFVDLTSESFFQFQWRATKRTIWIVRWTGWILK